MTDQNSTLLPIQFRRSYYQPPKFVPRCRYRPEFFFCNFCIIRFDGNGWNRRFNFDSIASTFSCFLFFLYRRRHICNRFPVSNNFKLSLFLLDF
jgi:hypothetical protein